jgi:hypothetical protein
VIDPAARPRPSPDVAAEPAHDELLVLDLSSGHYYGLNRVGQLIWQRLDGRTSLAEIADHLAEHFAVDRQRALDDVGELVAELVARGLVVTDPAP